MDRRVPKKTYYFVLINWRYCVFSPQIMKANFSWMLWLVQYFSKISTLSTYLISNNAIWYHYTHFTEKWDRQVWQFIQDSRISTAEQDFNSGNTAVMLVHLTSNVRTLLSIRPHSLIPFCWLPRHFLLILVFQWSSSLDFGILEKREYLSSLYS